MSELHRLVAETIDKVGLEVSKKAKKTTALLSLIFLLPTSLTNDIDLVTL